jgi:bifunctional DNA-binding transcriptional regulator/antitoxin component of YhaV-PrlF toxin-antitoxin module
MIRHQGFREAGQRGSTAAKIRALAAQGRSRADIARALGIRYQQVRNVLVRDEEKAKKTRSSDAATLPGKIRVAADGSAIVPAPAVATLGVKAGDVLFVRVESGEVHLLTRAAVARRVQALAREFVPEGVSLVDELLDERRREAEAESHDA